MYTHTFLSPLVDYQCVYLSSELIQEERRRGVGGEGRGEEGEGGGREGGGREGGGEE